MNTILKPDEIVQLKLIEKVEVTHDTNRYRFGFPNEDDVLGLPTGKHIALTFEDENGELVSRSYTPVSSDVDKGFVDFVIKVYRSNVHPDFPEGGVGDGTGSQGVDQLEDDNELQRLFLQAHEGVDCFYEFTAFHRSHFGSSEFQQCPTELLLGPK